MKFLKKLARWAMYSALAAGIILPVACFVFPPIGIALLGATGVGALLAQMPLALSITTLIAGSAVLGFVGAMTVGLLGKGIWLLATKFGEWFSRPRPPAPGTESPTILIPAVPEEASSYSRVYDGLTIDRSAVIHPPRAETTVRKPIFAAPPVSPSHVNESNESVAFVC